MKTLGSERDVGQAIPCLRTGGKGPGFPLIRRHYLCSTLSTAAPFLALFFDLRQLLPQRLCEPADCESETSRTPDAAVVFSRQGRARDFLPHLLSGRSAAIRPVHERRRPWRAVGELQKV